MKLPNELQCLKYFEEYKVPDNIFQHCLLVRKISIFLANELKKSGMDINIEFILACSSRLRLMLYPEGSPSTLFFSCVSVIFVPR